MQRVSLEIYTSAYEAVKILSSITDQKVELEIPKGSVLFDNILNLKLILRAAKKLGKTIDFVTEDPFGLNLIKILKGETEERTAKANETTEVNVKSLDVTPKTSGFSVKFPKFALPRIEFNFKKTLFSVSAFLVLAIVVGFLYLQTKHKAQIVLVFSPQKSVKSVQVKVGDGLKTDIEKKTLVGVKVSRTLEHNAEVATTGTKLEGEKAKGKVTLYNSTEEDITLKKGTKITYKNNDVSYVFTTDSEVTVPARTDSPPPETTIIKGTAEVSVTAESIGEAYNLKKEKEFSVSGYKSTQLTASNAEDFKGGSSREVRIVAQVDIAKLEQELNAYIEQSALDTLRSAVPIGFSLVEKSHKVTGKNIIHKNKVGDETTKASASITAQVEGLTYSKADLNNFMEKLSLGLVPPGFEFYSYSKDLQVEVLGNTENTVLSSTEADLQVTFRFFVVPKIDKSKLLENIAGKNPQEAYDYLKKINGVESVELRVAPNFVLFNKIPTRESAVEITTKVQE